MTGFSLSDRLELVASFVKPGSRVADVGTDHGFVPIALVKRGIAEKAFAMDVRPGPLSRAREHIGQYHLEEKIEVRLSDGVRELKAGEADTVIAAGMGGQLIVHILQDGRNLWKDVAHWILSPQSEPDKVRYFLQENGFFIEREAMVEEEGKYYVALDAVRGVMEPLSAWQALYGPRLLENRDPVLRRFLEREEKQCWQILTGLEGQKSRTAEARSRQLKEKLAWVEQCLKDW